MHEGGETVENILKGDGREQREGDTKILKSGASWVKGWCLKKRGTGTFLRTMSPPLSLQKSNRPKIQNT